MLSSEHQAGLNPAVVDVLAIAVLLLPTKLERGHAQIRQGQRSLRPFGLGLATQKLTGVLDG